MAQAVETKDSKDSDIFELIFLILAKIIIIQQTRKSFHVDYNQCKTDQKSKLST